MEEPNAYIVDYLRSYRFYYAVLVRTLQYVPGLIKTLIERWRPETHTFHLPYDECTITLEDVALQLGLSVDGKAVTGGSLLEWNEVCLELLGEIPPADCLKGLRLKIVW